MYVWNCLCNFVNPAPLGYGDAFGEDLISINLTVVYLTCTANLFKVTIEMDKGTQGYE